jgi:hypothetical protein
VHEAFRNVPRRCRAGACGDGDGAVHFPLADYVVVATGWEGSSAPGVLRLMLVRPQSRDTSAEIERRQIEAWRAMSAAQKLAIVFQLTLAAEELAGSTAKRWCASSGGSRRLGATEWRPIRSAYSCT